MNDEFLTHFREAPRAEFVDALYERISRQSQPRFDWKMVNKLTFRNAGVMFVLLFLVVACAYYVVTQTPYRKVGGIWLTVQKTQKVEYIPAPEVIEDPDAAFQTDECPSLEEAREILRFDFLVPTWAPEGFVFNGTVCGVDPISDFASLAWKGREETAYIGMTIQNLRWYDRVANTYRIGPAAVWEPVAPGSYKEVQVNGQPAVLVRGDWEYPAVVSKLPSAGELEAKWDKKLGLRLYWVDGEQLYYLYTRADISAEDLIKMAESAQ